MAAATDMQADKIHFWGARQHEAGFHAHAHAYA
jgi:hypothetical protein